MSKFVEIEIAGPTLMMHNSRLSDPLDKKTQALKTVSKKRQKTEEDHEELARLEFIGGLYCDDDIGPFIPSKWLNSMLIEGARKSKQGRAFEAGISVVEERNKLHYKGPRNAEALWQNKDFVDRRSVGVTQSRVMRTRPIFRNWSVKFAVEYDENQVDAQQIESAVEMAAPFGIGDGRPMFAGKFELTSFKEVAAK